MHLGGRDYEMQDPVFERIEKLLGDREMSQQCLLAKLGTNRSTYSNWKLGKSKSYLKQMIRLRNF